MRIGVLPLARPTFDVPFAEEMAAGAFAALEAANVTTVRSPAELGSAIAERLGA